MSVSSIYSTQLSKLEDTAGGDEAYAAELTEWEAQVEQQLKGLPAQTNQTTQTPSIAVAKPGAPDDVSPARGGSPTRVPPTNVLTADFPPNLKAIAEEGDPQSGQAYGQIAQK